MVSMISRDTLISIYIIIAMITAGFAGILVFEGIVDEGGVEAATIIVDKSGGGNFTTIQAAINAASAGDTIYVWTGTYNENILLSKTLTLIGNGSAQTKIIGDGVNNVIYISADFVNVSGFNITNGGLAFNKGGIEIFNSQYCVIDNNNISTNRRSGVLFIGAANNTVSNCTLMFNDYGAIDLITDSNNNMIKHNTISDNFIGIDVNSNNNTFLNNTILNNDLGVLLEDSVGNTLSNNVMTDDEISIRGTELNMWNSHSIDTTNTVNGKTVHYWKDTNGGTIPANAGLVILANSINVNVQNQNLDDFPAGVTLGFSSWNTVKDNLLSNVSTGIYLFKSDNNTLGNNNASSSSYGIGLRESNNNDMLGNTVMLNLNDGIYIDRSHNNLILNNIVTYNQAHGVMISISDNNTVDDNNLSANSGYGILLNLAEKNSGIDNVISQNSGGGLFISGTGNSFNGNTILNNTVGVNISLSSSNNVINRNNIISNAKQANEQGSNKWNLNNEGNYWSDYSGLDDGSGGRAPGDGIGDTGIPHLGLDNYPFVTRSGWITMIPPVLTGPASHSTDGTFDLFWTMNDRADSYVLEEDEMATFMSPITVYAGTSGGFKIINNPEGNYYYRVKSVKVGLESLWSNTLKVLVDKYPAAPTGLYATDITGHEATLSWTPPSDPDLAGFHLYVNDTDMGPSGPFNLLLSVPEDKLKVTVTKLQENTKYFYRLQAVDTEDQSSGNSVIVSGTTLLGPYSPEINNTITDFAFWEDKVDRSINLYYMFKDVNGDRLRFWCEGQSNIEVNINLDTGIVELTPKRNWNGVETLTFYAKDDDFEAIFDTIKITVSFVNDNPGVAEIVKPRDGHRAYVGDTINFQAYCNDPDMPYGETLYYAWSSSKTGYLGAGENLSVSNLPTGTHIITLKVSDSAGHNSYTTINVKVFEEETFLIGDSYALTYAVIAAAVIAVIIIILVVMMVVRKRRHESKDLSKEDRKRFKKENKTILTQPSPAPAGVPQPQIQVEQPAPQAPPPQPVSEPRVYEEVPPEPDLETADFAGHTRPVDGGEQPEVKSEELEPGKPELIGLKDIEEGQDDFSIDESELEETPIETEEVAPYDDTGDYYSQEQPQDPDAEYYPEEEVEYTDRIDEVLTPEQQKELDASALNQPPPPPQPTGYRVVLQPVIQPIYQQAYYPPVQPQPQQPIQPLQTPPPQPPRRFCPKCGTQLINTNICGRCGWQG